MQRQDYCNTLIVMAGLAAALASIVTSGMAAGLSTMPALVIVALGGAAGGLVYLATWRAIRVSESANERMSGNR